jgi:hypothetical protein
MRNKAVYLATVLCLPAVAALIANAPVAAADSMANFSACFPANVDRTAAQAGAVRSACSPYIPAPPSLPQGSSTTSSTD